MSHRRALNTPGCDAHAAFTALLTAGVTRRREAEIHESAPQIASPRMTPDDQALRAHTLLEQFAIRLYPPSFAGFLIVRRFTLRE